jgi:hypothetical protein
MFYPENESMNWLFRNLIIWLITSFYIKKQICTLSEDIRDAFSVILCPSKKLIYKQLSSDSGKNIIMNSYSKATIKKSENEVPTIIY